MTKKLRRLFPKLVKGQYRITSRKKKRYNCIAWAAGYSDAWWQARPDGVWPAGVLDDGTVEAAVRLFEHMGYRRSENNDSSLKAGVLKVAIYGADGEYTHAARQLPSGKWTSKIGKLQDIEHDSLEALSSAAELLGTDDDKAYGTVVQILEKEESSPASESCP